MTQEEHWDTHYNHIMAFMKEEKRRPSKHRQEEHQMLNWIKYQKKQLAKGKMNPLRAERFIQLLETAEQYQRKNQYAYTSTLGDNYCGDFFSSDADQNPAASSTNASSSSIFCPPSVCSNS